MTSSDYDMETDVEYDSFYQVIEDDPYNYEGYLDLIETLRRKGDLEAARAVRFKFHNTLLPAPKELLKWLEDEIESASIQAAKLKVKELFELSLKDYPASTEIWLEYLKFLEANPSVFSADDLNSEHRKAAAFPAWNLQKGHLLLQNSSSSGIPYTSKAGMDSNSSPFESFEETFPQNLEKYIEAVKNAKFMNSQDKLTLCRVLFERAIEIEGGGAFKIWEDYLKFLKKEMNVSSIILSVNHRLTRAHPLNVNSWILLCENMELFNKFDEFEHVWRDTLPRILLKSSHECFLTLQLARLDFLRRQGKKDEILLAFQSAIYDEEQLFSQGRRGEATDPQGRLQRYFGQVLLSFGEVERFRNVWQQLLKQHAKEAAFWLEYLQVERSLALQCDKKSLETVTNGFKRATAAVSDYPETIFYEWTQFERQHGASLESLLNARERIEKQRIILKEREQQRQQKEQKEQKEKIQTSHKRSRLETATEQIEKKPQSSSSSFNPDATLFVNNLPFSFTESDIKNHFNRLIPEINREIVKSIRMHMNSSGKSFKGHATIEFDSQETAEILLEKFNRKTADESGRPVFLAKYVSPLAQKQQQQQEQRPSKFQESDAKTLYISNLPSRESAKIEELFKTLPGIQQIRHVEGKQFAYIEFESETVAAEALNQIKTIDSKVKAAFSMRKDSKEVSKDEQSKPVTLLKPRSLSLKK